MPLLFPKNMLKATPKSRLVPLTLKGFGGGLNAVDDDFSMEPRYSKTLRNFRRTPSGGQQLRFGSNWFADVKDVVTGNLLDMTYFNGRLIGVTTTGQIATVNDSGIAAVGWNASIASLLPGSPLGWGSTHVAVSFVPFKDTLVIHNGVDKPITISSSFVFTYLQDLATGSNLNVPIGKYGAIASNYHCVAGVAGAPTTIYIGAVGTSGTFPGDPAPNDSITIDVGAYSPQGALGIRGLAGYRNFLIVFFQGQSLLVALGNYDANGVHKPQFPDTLPKFGLLGHRCITPVEHDIVFTGLDGYSDGKRNLFSGLVTSDHVSDRIEPLYRRITGNLTDSQQQNSCFLVHDPLWHDTILFNPSGRHFVHTGSENLHYSSWSEYSFPTAWTCACASFLGRVFYAAGTRIFQHGNAVFDGEDYHADRLNDRDAYWLANTIFSAGMLVRDDSNNYVKYSNDFGHAPDSQFFWSNTNSTIAALPGASPDPNNTSWQWSRNSTAAAFFGQVWADPTQPGLDQMGEFANQGARWTYSIYAKQGTGRYIALFVNSNDPSFFATVQATFDLQTGVVSLGPTQPGPQLFGNVVCAMAVAPNGFYRCSISFTDIPNNAKLRPFFSFNNVNGDLFVVDGITSNGLVYGMQLERRDVLGPYAPTTSAQKRIGTAQKSYTALINHISGPIAFDFDKVLNTGLWNEYTGLDITSEMELPWLGGKDPMKAKQLRFISVDTLGTAEFTLEAYVDSKYKDVNDNTVFGPALSLPFIGGQAVGFGFDAGPFGGGRRSDDPRLWGFPLKFKKLKLRFLVSAKKPLQIISASFLYSRGAYKR